ncbi:cysteine-rich CWC family protein [Pigmentiphaga humi]
MNTCPLCNGPNGCVPAIKGRLDVDCWCRRETFPPRLLERAAANPSHFACVCMPCLRAALDPRDQGE